MPTTVVSTIGTGGDYSTLQAWEDAAPANLVTADQIWEGRLKNQTFTVNAGWGSALTISGSTSDATRYKRLTCEAGVSFRDNAGKLTNALRYNTSNGAAIVTSANSSGAGCMSFDEAYCRVDSIQFSVTGSNNTNVSSLSANVTVEHCIIQSTGACLGQNYGTIRNCVLINVSNSASQSTLNQSRGTGVTVNCTVVTPSDHATTTDAILRQVNYGCTYKNCAFFGCTNIANSVTNVTTTNCYTSSSQSNSGLTQIAYDTSTGSGFEATTNASADFRIKSTSTLKDAGTSSGAPSVDIVDTARSGSYDVGAWEYTSGGGPSFTAKSLKPILQAIGGMY